MVELLKNPKMLILAVLSGLVPAIFWLWFWLKEEDDENHESLGLIVISFILGGLLVFLAIWLEKATVNFVKDNTVQIIIWAAIEELLKFFGVMIIVSGNQNVDRPIDYPMYFIATALGFAALENTLYLINPFGVSGAVVGMLTGNLRFLGSTLLHAMSSSMIGSAIGLSFYLEESRALYIFIGISCAILLHSVFNFFIMKGSGENFLSVFGFLWVVTIINILIFEKLKRMGRDVTVLK
ncbi:MAG: PrsW family glutamic-type intramembrane protease [Candidatus Nomurabacteria bacterium]|nr:PrsW family glutamic-type intramembrane protease [Candidatus Nomurabacteria bacterium]